MKKTYLLLALNLVLFNVMYAQIKWGIGAGPHNTTVIEKNRVQGWDQQYKGNFTPLGGFHAGIFSEINISKNTNWALQPALLYTNKGRKFSKSYDSTKSFINDTSAINASWKINYLELPVNLIYRIPLTEKVRFILGGGPYVSLQLNSKTTYEILNASGEREAFNDKMATGDAVNTYQKLHWGINALAGLDFNDRLLFTANYSRSMSDFYTAGYGGSFKHQLWGGTVVIWLTASKTTKIKASQKDSDGDGVPDKSDKCPAEMGTAATSGCPDTDGDGIPDNEDKCPGVAGISGLLGCPAPDRDKDGVADDKDKCPDVAGTAKYNGCPVPDSDGDGIADDKDNCLDIAGTAKYNGCPAPDTDGDGIDDDNDKCPLKAGAKANNGCPDIAKDMIDDINKAARSILFDVSSDNIKASSYSALDKLAEILQSDAEMKLDIEGHTDNTGSVRLNQVLSGRRALAIKNYLVKKGIATERLTALGFGSEHPIASNSTEEGRSKNRRVAFKVKY
ncbi:OmpA family protein [Agriterribacter sp.]|uniref:OmpA family protein n=1 Tax=Agriterribacter sp. TaxID=2821509 RepID=UPI002C689C39|nr:OmpA family protein [Agriterribacter sp.]HTN06397.1 OmpA family protein [Agriterribacter sp.]